MATENSRSPRQYTGVRAIKPPDLTLAKRAPTGTDTAYIKGELWLDTLHAAAYQWSGTTWISLGSGTTGSINTITGDSGGAETPLAGNFSLLGTANQITVTGGTNKETFSVPSTFVAPGSIRSVTTLTGGTGITATTGNIVASTGNITSTLGSVGAATTVTAGTSITATLGNITATNGNLVMGTAGNKIIVPTGSNASAGTSGVMSGSPGAVTVATTACSATAKVFYARNITGGTPGHVSITAQDGTGFTLTSTGNETSTFNWWIINA